MRLACLLGIVVAVGVGSVPGSAVAGGTGNDTGGDTGTGGGGTGGGGTGTGGGETGDSSCGTCQDPTAGPIVFVSPLDGDEVAGDLSVTIEASYACSCDDCGCFEDHPSALILTVDGAEAFACFDGCTGMHVVDLSLAPGPHQLVATGEYSFHNESATVNITVTGNAGTDGGASEGTGDGGGSSDGGKGGCRVGSGASPLALGGLLLALGVVRRRSRRR